MGLTVLTVGSLAPRAAHAEGPEVVELAYDRPAELATCPDEPAFRRAVTDRMRRDPFVSGAARKITVLLTRNGVTLTAVVRVEEGGHARGERRIDTRAGCAELASGAALAVSIAIDPLSALGLPSEPASPEPEPEPKPATPSAPKPAAPAAPKRAPTPKAARAAAPLSTAPLPDSEGVRSRAFVRAGMRAWVGTVPGVGVGPSFGFGYQHAHWSLALDAIGVLPRSATVPDARRAVSVAFLGAQLSPCLHASDVRVCVLLSSGALLAHGEGVDDTRTGASWQASSGLGVGYSFFVGRFFFTPSVDAQIRFTKTQLNLDGNLVWTTPRLVGSLGLEIGYDAWR